MADVTSRWTILEKKTMNGNTMYLARCACGSVKMVRATHVKSGRSRSCGCYAKEGLSHRKAPGHAGLTAVFLGYRKNAAARNLTFQITKDQFHAISQQNCFYCNSSPSNCASPYARSYGESIKGREAKEHASYVYNGIDRIDNNVGYELTNIIPCCKICNFAKNNSAQEDFIKWISKAFHHLKDKNATLNT